MLGIGSGELAIILVFGFLLFGPDKLPQMGRTIGRALRQFRETQERMTSVVQSEVIDPMTAAANAPLKPKSGTASADDDSDADAPAGPAAPQRKETFAERRARLAAEKAAKEAAAEGADVPEPAAAADAAPEQPAAEPEAAPEVAPEPEVRTTADLYARRPRKKAAVAEAPEPATAPATDSSKGGER